MSSGIGRRYNPRLNAWYRCNGKCPSVNNYTYFKTFTIRNENGTFEELVTFRVEGEYLVPTMIAGVEIAAEEAEDEEANMEDEATAEMEAENPMKGLGARVMGMA